MTVQRLAEQLIRLACRNLPGPDRAIRCQEWTAEAAAILDDPETRSLARRQIRTLLFAADHLRGARRMAGQAYYPVTGWRKIMPAVFAACAWCVANYGTLWLPFARPVRLVLVELILGAAMAYQVIRERRHWPPGSKREFDLASARRIGIAAER